MYNFAQYGRSITNDDIAGKIKKDLENECCDDKELILDFSNVDLLTTTCIKMIFIPIVNRYGKDKFLQKIEFHGTTRSLQLIISHALENLIDES